MSEKLSRETVREAIAEYEADSERTGVPVEDQLGVEAVFYRAAQAWVDSEDALITDTPIQPDIVGWAIAIISNVSEGDWSKQSAEWQKAARKWLDAAHTPIGLGHDQ